MCRRFLIADSNSEILRSERAKFKAVKTHWDNPQKTANAPDKKRFHS
jgi:hypothetical protein